MVSAPHLQHCVATLWSLVGACRAGEAEAAQAAARAAAAALDAAAGPLRALHLAESGGVLLANGAPLPLEVRVFAAAEGLATLLRELDLDYVCFDAGVEAGELVAWAERCAEARGSGRPAPGGEPAPPGAAVHVAIRRDAGDPVRGTNRRACSAAETDSRLRSVFLQFHLLQSLGRGGPVPPGLAKVIVQAIVDRLLQVPRGLEPLVLLQAEPARLRRGTEVAILTVLFARVAGWPDDRLADLGGAALLHDLGALLDPHAPGAAGFAWLLGQGTDEFWLRSALIARSWADDDAIGGDEGLAGAGGAALVRLASVAAACLDQGGGPEAARARLHAGAARPLAPQLLEVADAALQSLA
ncbi:MAG: hypothetical protein KF830_14295 [Planctomycetes bacterium]|nr:hypothetical protein [Planctomycetota bacterium]